MTVPIHPPVRWYALSSWVAALVATGALYAHAHAQSAMPPLWTRDSIYSTILGETRYVRISLPMRYDAREYATEQYPVLIVLDAEADVPFAAAVANARALAGTVSPAMPRLLVVGVETPMPARFRDMTLPPTSDTVKRRDGGGGAPAFLRFLSTELRPYLERRYRIQPVTVLAGHSLTAFFAEWAFGQAPDFVTGAIALSPSPFAPARVVNGIAARGRPGRLFVVTGTAERGLDSAARAFAATVRARNVPGLAFEHERIPDVSHEHTGSLGMVPGLRFIFRPVSLAGYQVEFDDDANLLSTFSAAFDSSRTAYLRGARELGLPQRLPLGFLIGQSQWYQDSTTAPLRLRLCQEMISSYPALWTGFECAGDAHTRMGRSAEAAADYRRATDAARAAGDSAAADRLARKVPPSSR